MKTDKLFYRLFQSLPDLFFTLTGLGYSSDLYEFKFTIDGVFVPKQKKLPIIFSEVQFQQDEHFYSRLFTEIFIYLRQYKPENPWRAVAIFPDKATDVGNIFHYKALEPHLQRIYLRKSLPEKTTDASLKLLQMIIVKNEQKAIDIARELIEDENEQQQKILLYDFIKTIIQYRCPGLSIEEIEKMIHFSKINVEQTPLYQEALEKGIVEGVAKGEHNKLLEIIVRHLKRRFGELNDFQNAQIESLSSEKLDVLEEISWRFESIEDLNDWLTSNSKLLN